jgi:hypothetical protein
VYVTGSTSSTDFPLRNAWQASKTDFETFTEGFLTKFNPQLTDLVYSTYYGGDASDEPRVVSVGANGTAIITGLTSSPDLSVPQAVQPTITGLCLVGSVERYCYDGFVATFSPAGQLEWASYWGGAFDDMAYGVLARNDGVYIVGRAESPGMSTTSGVLQPNKAGNDDAFLLKIGSQSNGGGGGGGGQYQMHLPLVRR